MASTSTARSGLDRFFRISERGSTIGREVRGGVVTFVTMAYIIVLNPLILGSFSADDPGAKRDLLGHVLPVPQVAAVTALVAGVMTILFGLVANYPFAIATGLGINTLLAVTIAPQMTWPEAMGLVVVDGLIILLLVATGFRTAVFNAVPAELKAAISVGIGLFICLIGLVDAGFVRRVPDAANTTVPVGLGINGSIASWPTAIFVFGLLLTGVLVARRVRGGLLIGVLGTTVLAIALEAVVNVGPSHGSNAKGWNLGYPALPDKVVDLPDLSLFGDVSFGAWTRLPAITVALLVFTLVLANFFDAMGTMTGLGKEAGLVDKDNQLPGVGKALFVEGVGAVAGGVGSASSNTVFVESAAGIAEGARTGLANVVTGVLLLAAMFLTPLYQVIPVEAAAPALVVVGALMIGQIREIDFSDFTIGLPAFLTIVVMPFTYSIANGIGAGFISYVVLRSATGRARSVHPLMWVVAVAFVAYFAIGPIRAAFGA
ncbi:putative MFS transporter, AGZA family, xanthine/uracil permease [Streptoalloteichus tenebrarius]|uniref:MFS transporter, AGZA family, xanthine/uracil permease n=1 Tax=Streptoalloteichus tenebrarius (strain ATCC 17920 / DSM 40477 / JCM 4838 / CBS 697.72 / NBRC 16177 / NCIMB 11028 / NRRL B-12390 / A12253. 1 / ISP 5477) TaxID=1933 RepID=A0ABT1HVI7_STRSD|nr:NCS2 family permease [Streptoalloteichus tenebrarius]MCP2259528.1 putative MFS transporter, AGZA family, xanthine/uracil permease [Streptoalloteichus tenebrarius]BFF01391.1 NCS2 family permease [Streptoalloteichus tenebrarius]